MELGKSLSINIREGVCHYENLLQPNHTKGLSYENYYDDDYYEDLLRRPITKEEEEDETYFDLPNKTKVTGLVGGVARLACSVQNLGDKTVSGRVENS